MSLPQINNLITYEIEIPSTGKKIKYRPFLVKEEKILLQAQESEDLTTIVNAIKQIINLCTFESLNVDDLAMFDIEYLITQIRAKSVGEIVELKLRCDVCADEKAVSLVEIDLSSMKIEKNPEHTKNIKLTENVGVSFKYPSFDILKRMDDSEITANEQFDIIAGCIDFIYDDEKTYPAKETPKEELEQWIEGLNKEQMENIGNFFKTQPKLSKKINYTCPICNKEHEKVLEGLQSFF